jgi:hypothetical protein
MVITTVIRKNYIIWCGNYFGVLVLRHGRWDWNGAILIYSVWAYVY